MGKVDRDQLDLGLALRINVRRYRLQCHQNRNDAGITYFLKRWEVQYSAGTMWTRREKIVFKRLALPVTITRMCRDVQSVHAYKDISYPGLRPQCFVNDKDNQTSALPTSLFFSNGKPLDV